MPQQAFHQANHVERLKRPLGCEPVAHDQTPDSATKKLVSLLFKALGFLATPEPAQKHLAAPLCLAGFLPLDEIQQFTQHHQR